MRDERDLLQAIIESPDDDDLRLVYADLLTSRGDPRGEFIVVQVELARLGVETATAFAAEWSEVEPAKIARAVALLRRQDALVFEHSATWSNPVAAVSASFKFRRGFLDCIHLARDIDFAVLVSLASSGPPISTLIASNVSQELFEMLTKNETTSSRLLRQLDALEVTRPAGTVLPEETFDALFASCPKLTKLRVSSIRGLEPLRHLKGLPQGITDLDLSSAGLTGELLADLRSAQLAPIMKRLRSLDVSHNDVDFEANHAASPLDASAFPALEHLGVAGVGQLRGAVSAQSVVPPRLRSLDINYNKMGSDNLVALLSQRPLNRTLETLRAYGVGWSDDACVTIMRLCTNLKNLQIGGDISEKAHERVLLAGSSLTHIAVDTYHELAQPFYDAVFSQPRRSLLIKRNSRPLTMPASFIRAVQLREHESNVAALRLLELEGWDWSVDADLEAAFAKSPLASNLRSLRLSSCLVGSRGAEVLFASPDKAVWSELAILDLSQNGLRDRSVQRIAKEWVTSLPQLVELKLGDRYDGGSRSILRASVGAILKDKPFVRSHREHEASIVLAHPSCTPLLDASAIERIVNKAAATDQKIEIDTKSMKGKCAVWSRMPGCGECGSIKIDASQKRSNTRYFDIASAYQRDGFSVEAETVRTFEGRIVISYQLGDRQDLWPILLMIVRACLSATHGVALDNDTGRFIV